MSFLDDKNDFSSYCQAIRDIINGKFDWEKARRLETILSEHKGEIKEEDGLCSYIYFLMDPKIAKKLFNLFPELLTADLEKFKLFILAIFYCGKGTRDRSFSHEQFASLVDEKGRKILEIEKTGYKVSVLQIFNGISDTEASTRESILIETLGVSNLTNCRNSKYKSSFTLPEKDRAYLGAYWLYKAFILFSLTGTTRPIPGSQVTFANVLPEETAVECILIDDDKKDIAELDKAQDLKQGDSMQIKKKIIIKDNSEDFPNKKKAKSSKQQEQKNKILNYFKKC